MRFGKLYPLKRTTEKKLRKLHMARTSETSEYGEDFEFDPVLDFSKFLDEARGRKSEQGSPRHSSPAAENDRLSEFKKNKKSWKSSLVSWWPKAYKKFEKKSKSRVEPASSSQSSNPKRKHVSGPIYTKRGGTGKLGEESRTSSSGALTGLLRSSRAVESEIPYTALDLYNPRRAKPYGPVYFVT